MGRLIDAGKLKAMFQDAECLCALQIAILGIIDEQRTGYDPDKVVNQLKAASYERYGNDGMGGELVVNLDDALKIVKGGGVDAD